MPTLQATWNGERLHLWGIVTPGHPQTPGSPPSLASHAELRSAAGELWDSLLASSAQADQLTLHLLTQPDSDEPETSEFHVPTLSFGPAEAVDVLTTATWLAAGPAAQPAPSFEFWTAAARLALALLSGQRFVPDVERLSPEVYRAHWRPAPLPQQLETMQRLARVMPGVCLSGIPSAQHSSILLLENFEGRVVDALVRQTLAGDELTHGILSDTNPSPPILVRWIRALLSEDSILLGSPAETAAIYYKVREWIERIEPASGTRTCRLRLTLLAPDSGPSDPLDPAWRLDACLQAADDPGLTLSLQDLDTPGSTSRLVPTPFQNAREQWHADLAVAARIYPPLHAFLEDSSRDHLMLTTTDAYAFLRDAPSLLEVEGIAVEPPAWWRQDRPRLRMRMDLKPVPEAETDGSMGLEALVVYDWRIALGDDDLSQDEVQALAMASEPIVRLRGRWLEIQPAEVKNAARFRNSNPGGKIKLFEALRQCYMVDDLETGLAISGLRGEGWIERVLNAARWHDADSQEVETPSAFRGELRPYQLRGLRWLDFMSRLGLGACLADDMGLGKTIQLIALLLLEQSRTGDQARMGPTLLVVPMSLVGNWRRELERFAPSLRVMVHHGLERRSGESFLEEARRHDVVICTYALAHRDFDHLSALEWRRVALDEAQNIKNPAAKQSAAVRSFRAVHRVALTGTPVENRLSELWSILNFLVPGYLGSGADFRRRFAVPIERHHDVDRASRLRDLIRPFILRRLKTDPGVQIDLPMKMEAKVFCNLTREQAGLYEAIVQEVLGRIENADGMQRRGLILAALTRLKQICNHPAHFLADGSSLPHRSGKCERLVEMLDEVLAEGDRALIFTQYREMGSLLHKLVSSTFSRDVLFLHGGTPRLERDNLVQQFQRAGTHDPSIFILSLKAGGFGLNLTAANHVFHFDRWWNPAVEDQATDRTHRIGQTRAVQVHKFICIGTLEERIDAMLMTKRSLAENIIGAGEQWITELSTAALRELFVLSRDDAVGDE